jgi:hypothetical protein
MKLFPEREVFGTALWVKAVNAVSEQEDYVKSLERQMEERKERGLDETFVSGFLDSARKRLIVLRSQLKEIDEGDANGS